MKMRTDIVKILAALVGLLYVSIALAVPPDGKGKPDDGSGNEPPDYGDLYILLRDESGVPILTPGQLGDASPTCDAGFPAAGTGCCQQPLAAEPFEGCLLPDGTAGVTTDPECTVIPVDPVYCTVLPDYVLLTQEPEFARLNEMRSPDSVFEAQLQDVTTTLATAGCISLDPAGRLVASTKVIVDDSDPDNIIYDVVTSTIDSPLGNLAILRQLMLEGTLGETIDAKLETLLGPDWQLITAARAGGAAAGKDDKYGVDLQVYMNEIMGLTDQALTSPPMLLPNDELCIYPREEVMGVLQTVEKCFLNYGNVDGSDTPFSYARQTNFSTSAQSLPNPAYIPDDTSYGWFEYLAVYGSYPYFEVLMGPMLDAVPELIADPSLSASNIGGFVQAADDTRAVINFMHTWPVPGEYATKVACEVEGGDFFDVSISDVSGLQVPVNMTSGTWRSGTVTVVNAGPGDAVGGVSVTGEIVGVGPVEFCAQEPAEEDEGCPLPLSFPQPFNLAEGENKVVTFYFTAESPAKTVIDWHAAAEPTCADCDVNTDNNEVDATTTLNKSGGGGGGGQGGGNPND
jgi:hypothetical protein